MGGLALSFLWVGLAVLLLVGLRRHVYHKYPQPEVLSDGKTKDHAKGIWAHIKAVSTTSISQGNLKVAAQAGFATPDLLIIRFFLAFFGVLVYQAVEGYRNPPPKRGARARPTTKYKVVMGHKIPVKAGMMVPLVEGAERFWAYTKAHGFFALFFRGIVFMGTIGGIWMSTAYMPVFMISSIGAIEWPAFAQMMQPHFSRQKAERIRAKLLAEGADPAVAEAEAQWYITHHAKVYGQRHLWASAGIAAVALLIQRFGPGAEPVPLADFLIGNAWLAGASVCTALNAHLGERAGDLGEDKLTSLLWQQLPGCVILPSLFFTLDRLRVIDWSWTDVFVVHRDTSDWERVNAPVMTLLGSSVQLAVTLSITTVLTAAFFGVYPQLQYLVAGKESTTARTVAYTFFQLPVAALVDLAYGAIFGWNPASLNYYATVPILMYAGWVGLRASIIRARALEEATAQKGLLGGGGASGTT